MNKKNMQTIQITQKTDKISVIIPALNEAKTVCDVIDEVLKLKEVSEIILVNDGSTDQTEEKIIKYKTEPRFVYTKHHKNQGKGIAVKTGLSKAKNEVVLLLDADLKNITYHKLRKIILPVINGEVDLSRAGFRLSRGRVTEIAVKPMMRILFPGVYFDQPISGQVCGKKSFLQTVDLEAKWGVDIGILLDAIQAGQRIVEVDIGKLDHKARTDAEKADMAEQVMETMIKKAGLIQHKYRLVIFTLDNTLLPQKSLEKIFLSLGIKNEEAVLKEKLEKGEINFKEFIEQSALLFKGLSVQKIEKIVNDLPLVKYADEVISALKKRKYQVAVISSNFSPIVGPIARHLGINLIDCVSLESQNGKILTGNIYTRSAGKWLEKNAEIAFEKAFHSLLNRAKVKPLQAVMVANSVKCSDLFLQSGLSVAFKPDNKSLKEIANKTITILPELLAIME